MSVFSLTEIFGGLWGAKRIAYDQDQLDLMIKSAYGANGYEAYIVDDGPFYQSIKGLSQSVCYRPQRVIMKMTKEQMQDIRYIDLPYQQGERSPLGFKGDKDRPFKGEVKMTYDISAVTRYYEDAPGDIPAHDVMSFLYPCVSGVTLRVPVYIQKVSPLENGMGCVAKMEGP